MVLKTERGNSESAIQEHMEHWEQDTEQRHIDKKIHNTILKSSANRDTTKETKQKMGFFYVHSNGLTSLCFL